MNILNKPRITEKAALLAETKNTYVFEIGKAVTKPQVAKAVKTLYKVEPLKVNIVKLPAKKVFSRGKRGSTSSVRKAYVVLKKGDKIELA